MLSSSQVAAFLGALAVGQVRKVQRARAASTASHAWSRWLGEPRNAVFLVLASALLLGGGRKLLHAWRARRAVGHLNEEGYTETQILETTQYGRAGLMDLFRILGTAETESLRNAAGRAISVLWAHDELVKEEEIALIRRGFQVTWKARRRYPRSLDAPLPIQVSYGVPFLREGEGIGPENLEWSHRILGAQRAALESFSPWQAGPAHHNFTLIPADFETNGPHKLVLQARVRTTGLTDSWELELPHMPFQFEFDPRLAPEALFALPDDARAQTITQAVTLVPVASDESDPARYLPLNEELALRNPPLISVASPLPCDLAHQVEVEFEGLPGSFPTGSLIVSGDNAPGPEVSTRHTTELSTFDTFPLQVIERPGNQRMRLVLKANPHLGWAEPHIRSVWPGTIETGWVDVRVVRR